MIPLYKPYMPDVPLVDDILHSGQLAYGKYGREFERLLCEYIGVPDLIVTNTFNMAILVSLTTLGIKAGDSVIASPMACLASTQPLLSMGIRVQWADVVPTTGTLCPDSVKSLMHIGPKAIIHNHFCGHVGFVDEINSIGREYGVPVIDDCIEAFGSEYKGQIIGNLATDITIFSFGPVRIPNTLDGGAVVFKDTALYTKSVLARDAGIDRSRFRDELGEINPDCDIKIAGQSATPMELNCYIGTQQMKHVDRLIGKQRENAAIWNTLIKDQDELRPITTAGVLPNYWIYGTLANNKKATILKFREKGLYASGVHIKNNLYSVFGDKTVLPGVNEFYDHFVALPCGWWIEDEIVC